MHPDVTRLKNDQEEISALSLIILRKLQQNLHTTQNFLLDSPSKLANSDPRVYDYAYIPPLARKKPMEFSTLELELAEYLISLGT